MQKVSPILMSGISILVNWDINFGVDISLIFDDMHNFSKVFIPYNFEL